jgi:hypothetical protein
MATKRKISELDYQTNPGIIDKDSCVFNKANLEGFTKRQLAYLIHRHAQKAMRGNFWSFQIVNSAAAMRVFGAFE